MRCPDICPTMIISTPEICPFDHGSFKRCMYTPFSIGMVDAIFQINPSSDREYSGVKHFRAGLIPRELYLHLWKLKIFNY